MSLFWKIFISFMIAMTITSVGAMYVSYRIVSRPMTQTDSKAATKIISEVVRGARARRRARAQDVAPRASAAGAGHRAARDERARRRVARPRDAARARALLAPGRRAAARRPPNLRPMQLTPTIRSEQRGVSAAVRARARHGLRHPDVARHAGRRALASRSLRPPSMSLLLARYLSSPIVRLQKASRALAAGALDTRVGAPFTRRSDEVGTLARDFDAMAERIQALVTDKETLLRDVSHELRSPLARIRMALALAQRRAGAAVAARSRAHRARSRAARRARRPSHDADAPAHGDAPRRDIVRLDTLVGEVVDDARFEYPERGRVLRRRATSRCAATPTA